VNNPPVPFGVPPDRNPGVAVAICYRTTTARAMPAPWPMNAQIARKPMGGFCSHEYWPVTANSIMLFGLRKRYGERALCVPLG